jgi:nucleotide-binding universal stress UspA family protein
MEESMVSVLCVTRDGKGGIRAQKEAIRIAKDRGDSLVFLFVADSSFLNKLAAPIVVDIKEVLESMGRFILSAAIERASSEGVNAVSLIHYGVWHTVLLNIVSEIDPTIIIIGHLEGNPSCIEKAEMENSLYSLRE